MKAQSREPLLDLEYPYGTDECPATFRGQVPASMQADTTAMVVEAGAGGRAPSMSMRFDTEESSTASELRDEFLFLMALDSDISVDAPADVLADAMREDEAGQGRTGLRWPPLPFAYPVLVVPAERLEAIRVAKESGLLVQAQQGLSGPGLDEALCAYRIAPPIVPAPAVTPAQTHSPHESVLSDAVPATAMSDDHDPLSIDGEADDADTLEINEIAVHLRTCRKALAASGTFAMQELIDLLADNAGTRQSQFLGGEAARIDITRELIDLLGDMLAMHGTPQARFDQTCLDRFGESLLQWCGHSSYALSRSVHGQRYSVGSPALVAENVINTIVLDALCRTVSMRDFMLGKFSGMGTELKTLFKMSTKIKILRQWAAGEIALSPTELRLLCMLKISSNASTYKLLSLIRSQANQ